jgi:hypothetical protein
VATDPARCASFFAELSEVVRESRRAVLIRLRRPARWLSGPIIGIHLLRDSAGRFGLGPGLWLGPLTSHADRRALCEWLRRGGPQAGPPPHRLQCLRLCPPIVPIMALQTRN